MYNLLPWGENRNSFLVIRKSLRSYMFQRKLPHRPLFSPPPLLPSDPTQANVGTTVALRHLASSQRSAAAEMTTAEGRVTRLWPCMTSVHPSNPTNNCLWICAIWISFNAEQRRRRLKERVVWRESNSHHTTRCFSRFRRCPALIEMRVRWCSLRWTYPRGEDKNRPPCKERGEADGRRGSSTIPWYSSTKHHTTLAPKR